MIKYPPIEGHPVLQSYTTKMRKIRVYNGGAAGLTQFQVCVEIGGDFTEKADVNHLKFMQGDEELYYWVEEWKRPSGKARIWIKVPNLPAGSTETIYLYYGGRLSSNRHDGDQVFEFFDDFDGSSLDTSKWTVNAYASYSIQNSWLTLATSADNNWANIKSEYVLNSERIARCRFKGNYGFTGHPFFVHATASSNRVAVSDYGYTGEEIGTQYAEDGTWSYPHAFDTFTKGRLLIAEITRKTSTSFRVSLKGVDGTDFGSDERTYSGWSSLDFSIQTATEKIDQTFHWDFVAVRKYAETEPDVTLGEEENYFKIW